jgi:hypothetical protein
MTRMCRAQFEHDDIAEAEIVCGRDREHESEQEVPSEESAKDILDQSGLGLIQANRRHSSMFTWRLPAWVNFSYSTMQHRPHRQRRRQPNPFGPRSQNFSRLNSVSQDLSRAMQPVEQLHPKSASSPAYQEFPWGGPTLKPTINNLVGNDTDSSPVVDHPPPVPWDDQTTVDLPYDNPFYTRDFANVLWLPRDPTGILDLDDTIDLKVSLTVDPAAGKLGTWLGLAETASPEEMSEGDGQLPASIVNQSSSGDTTFFPTVDGTEEIDLPVAIARRVQSKEDGIEKTVRPRRPSAYRSKVSGSDKSSLGPASALGPGQARRRPSVLDDTSLPLAFRSFSDGNGRGRPSLGRGRSSSIMSALQLPPRTHRSRSTDHEFGVRPDRHAQADFVAANTSGSRLSLATPSRSNNLSTSDAITYEVMAEESAALHARIEDEQAEAQSVTTKSWLTSWMFKKAD